MNLWQHKNVGREINSLLYNGKVIGLWQPFLCSIYWRRKKLCSGWLSHWVERGSGFIHSGHSPRNRWLTQKTLKSKAFGHNAILSCRPCWHPRAWWGGSLDQLAWSKACHLFQCGWAMSGWIYLSPSRNATVLTDRASKTLPRAAQHLCMCVH